MRLPAVLGAIAGAMLVIPTAGAQTAAAPPPVFQRTTLVLAPATMGAWRNGLRLQAEAAKKLNLPPAEVGWWAGNDGNRTILVSPASREALFRTPQLNQKISRGDSSAAAAIRAAFQGSEILSVTTEIFQVVENLRYQPANEMPPADMTGWVTVEYWILPGQRQAFNQAIQAMNKVYADVKYPYARNMSVIRMGQSRLELTIFIDSRETYFGKNSFGRLSEGNTAAREAMTAARQALNKTVRDMRISYANYAPALSYPPGM